MDTFRTPVSCLSPKMYKLQQTRVYPVKITSLVAINLNSCWVGILFVES